MTNIVWLQDIGQSDNLLAGNKAARLGELLRSGIAVPPGFCVTTAACHMLTAPHDAGAPGVLMDLQYASDVLAARPGWSPSFAVRSSATAEDLASASFAGQYSTYLNVSPVQLVARVLDCCASASSPQANAYRSRLQPESPGALAVLVQSMVPCEVSGIAFSVDPVGGHSLMVIEAAPGVGDQVAGGKVTPHRYTIDPDTGSAVGDDLLSPEALARIVEILRAAERTFGGPQDLEWGLAKGKIYVLQARPITTSLDGDGVFTERVPAGTLWTSGFLNERFHQPVSPLGWSLLRPSIEQFAYRETLHFLGTPGCDSWQLTRLFRGHPYTDGRVFQTIYKVFPDLLLPEDATRFFINRDVRQRKEVPYPAGILDPRFLLSMLAHFLRDARNWSPLHNAAVWERFAGKYDKAIDRARRGLDTADTSGLLDIAASVQRASGRLLAIHRWSLTDAEVFYSLLRRMLAAWVSPVDAADLAAALTSGTGNLSLATNHALDVLVRLAAAADPSSMSSVAKDEPAAQAAAGRRFRAAYDDFMATYGHRSPSLDVYEPPFVDSPALILELIRARAARGAEDLNSGRNAHGTAGAAARREQAELRVAAALTQGWIERAFPLRLSLIRWVITMTRRYLPLRENQRFYWQKGIAVLRHVYLRLGRRLQEGGILEKNDDIFFLTVEEVDSLLDALSAPPGSVLSPRPEIAVRRRIFARLSAEWAAAPQASYPPFLQGDSPLPAHIETGVILTGLAVSPGVATGPAHILLGAAGFGDVSAGCILVSPSTDPAWTPIFARVAGMILETGGQLSHGAVVAREYGLPTVAGIAAATTTLREGEVVTVNGSTGIVLRDRSG